MKYFLLLPLVLMLLTGCLPGGRHVITSSARVPFEVDAQATGSQKRIIPWSNRELRASSRYDLPVGDEATGELSLGLIGANRRLAARDAVLTDIARQLDALEASEPPPGERGNRSVGQFSRNRPALQRRLNEALLAIDENVVHTVEGRVMVEVVLPLKDIAELILNHGGGFLPEGNVGSEFGPRQRAAIAAERQAMEELMRKVSEYQPRRNVTIADWLRTDANNARILREHLNRIRVTKSEKDTERPRGETEDKEFWVFELEFDARPLRDQIDAQVRRIEAQRRQLERER